jgi:hypothetical protein
MGELIDRFKNKFKTTTETKPNKEEQPNSEVVSLSEHKAEKEFDLSLNERRRHGKNILNGMKELFHCDKLDMSYDENIPEGICYILIGKQAGLKYNRYMGLEDYYRELRQKNKNET